MLKMEAPQRSNRVPATKKTQQPLAERSALALINIINIKKIFALFALKKSSILHYLSSIIHHPSSILHPPSPITHPPSSIIHHPSSYTQHHLSPFTQLISVFLSFAQKGENTIRPPSFLNITTIETGRFYGNLK
jgi:hypothetical protein